MKRTLTIAALVLLATGSAAFAAAPEAVAQAVCACCDAIAACCEACSSSTAKPCIVRHGPRLRTHQPACDEHSCSALCVETCEQTASTGVV